MKLRIAPKYIPLAATALVLGTLYAAGCGAYANFASLRVLVDLVGENAVLGVAALGATFVILSGGIDLSVGSVVAATGILIAVLVGSHGLHPLVAIAIALLLGTGFGAAMGVVIHRYQVPAFLVTLAGMFLARGLAFVVHPQSLGIRHPLYAETIVQGLAVPLTARVGFPFWGTCFLLLLLAALFVAHYTRFGRAVYAVGGDEQSAMLMGVPVGRTRVLVYTLAGFLSAAAGVVSTFYKQSGDPASWVGFELDAIAAVVIGGTLLSGGVGFVAGTAMGVLILGLIQSLITFQGNLNTWWTKIATGLLVLGFILLQNVVAAASRRSRARADGGAERPARPRGQPWGT